MGSYSFARRTSGAKSLRGLPLTRIMPLPAVQRATATTKVSDWELIFHQIDKIRTGGILLLAENLDGLLLGSHFEVAGGIASCLVSSGRLGFFRMPKFVWEGKTMGQAQSRGLNLRGSPGQLWLQPVLSEPSPQFRRWVHLFRCCRAPHGSDQETDIGVVIPQGGHLSRRLNRTRRQTQMCLILRKLSQSRFPFIAPHIHLTSTRGVFARHQVFYTCSISSPLDFMSLRNVRQCPTNTVKMPTYLDLAHDRWSYVGVSETP